jgi:hypothetical protein
MRLQIGIPQNLQEGATIQALNKEHTNKGLRVEIKRITPTDFQDKDSNYTFGRLSIDHSKIPSGSFHIDELCQTPPSNKIQLFQHSPKEDIKQ